ncbi:MULTISPECIES: hypothetical protein [unclassified Mycolicibacterium]|uniref:hypothetical protein n=1 Tax=unclassified Mycolicibacterium TaxID=2636767 RepID=UPI002EDB8841
MIATDSRLADVLRDRRGAVDLDGGGDLGDGLELDVDYIVHQIKEKFGTLRYYYYWPSSDTASLEVLAAMDAITGEAERESATTCERCGQPGILRQTRQIWVKTLCDSCAGSLGYVLK